MFVASLHQFGPQSAWEIGLDPFLTVAAEMNTHFVAFSWSEQRKASYEAVALLMTAAHHAATGQRVVPWRQGLYGAALTGVGAARTVRVLQPSARVAHPLPPSAFSSPHPPFASTLMPGEPEFSV